MVKYVKTQIQKLSQHRTANRKFKLAVSCLILITVLLLTKYISQDTYQILFMFSTGGYLGANVVEKFKQ